jgi:hypothetical protein
MRASLQRTDRVVTDAHGAVVAVQDLVVIRPEDGPVAVETRILARSILFRVVQCYPMPDERRPSYYQLALERYAGSTNYPAGNGPGSGS